MKTTLELPDDLIVEIKVRAAQERRSMKDVVTELLRSAMHGAPDYVWPEHEVRVSFPLVLTGEATAGAELTPQRASEILTAQEAEWTAGDRDTR
ncbi:hypothetical protein [Nocardioides limicola]|uniref:hypothetical protein n=1 Tax=Nocardioides limicola TaxID=2803368 RepID=UPI00193BC2FC|nr:hypothetical protein [Nocardioides sp. DJM-14]